MVPKIANDGPRTAGKTLEVFHMCTLDDAAPRTYISHVAARGLEPFYVDRKTERSSPETVRTNDYDAEHAPEVFKWNTVIDHNGLLVAGSYPMSGTRN